MTIVRHLHRLVFLSSLACLAGCEESEAPTGTVSGKVTLAGKPLPAGEIIFVKGDGIASGVIFVDPEGAYAVDDPMPVGDYKVSVSPPPPPQPHELMSGVKIPETNIPKKYWNAGSSGLVAKVEPGENVVNLNLE